MPSGEELPRRGMLFGLTAVGVGSPVRSAGAQRPGRAAVRVQYVAGFADELVRTAIASLPKVGGADLVFEPGRYVFSARSGTKLLFAGIQSLTIIGNGAKFTFASGDTPILFRGCTAPSIRNLSIDWSRPPFTQTMLIAVRDNGHVLDLLLMPNVRVFVDQSFGAVTEIDGRTGLMGAGAVDIYGGLRVTGVTGNRVTIHSMQAISSQPGTTLLLRHQLYGANALHFTDCSGGMEVTDVTVNSAPGMAVYARACQGDIRVSHFTVRPRAGTGRLMSTNADAVHLDGCTGTATIKQSVFEGMGDDGVNVHSGYLRIASFINRRTMLVESRAALSADAMPRAGALLALLSGRTLSPVGAATLSSASYGNPAQLSFDIDLPPGLKPGDLVADPSRRVSVTVSDCAFLGNRGRGIVAHGSAEIERCRFVSQSRAAICLAPDTFWLECCEVSGATVRANSMTDSCRSLPSSLHRSAAIEVTAITGSQGSFDSNVATLINHNVTIMANHIVRSHGSAIIVDATQEALISNNLIENPYSAAIRLDRVEQIVLSGNRCHPASSVERRDAAAGTVRLLHNIGLSLT